MADPVLSYAIHPAVGIARLGNLALDVGNAATWYMGPEAPWQTPNEGGNYKALGQIRKQAQRFRIYEFADGVAQREITLDAADIRSITWTVHLANRKSALDTASSQPAAMPGVPPSGWGPARTRNAAVADRASLALDPGPLSLSSGTLSVAAGITMPDGKGGTLPAEVGLGTLAVEEGTGRLLVFAADGVSRGVEDGRFTDTAPLPEYANNDGWYDDTADGRVTAELVFADGRRIALDGVGAAAWVICTAPKYTPGMAFYTTLHDVALDMAGATSGPVSFLTDIYPILCGASRLCWVNADGARGHIAGRGNWMVGDAMARLADPGPEAAAQRQAIFARMRDPSAKEPPDYKGTWLMPRSPQDILNSPSGDDGTAWDVPAVTPSQYRCLQAWAAGNFVNDWTGSAPALAFDAIPVASQPAALDRAALDGTAGTPFFPGIESWQMFRTPALWAAPLRVAPAARPGDLSLGNALPWQADFLDCDDTWWPVQRPTMVHRAGAPAEWVPPGWGAGGDDPAYAEMVANWWRLGFVVSEDGGVSFVETERDPDLPA